ncbi:hypothetical protein HSUHS1_0553 [Helicobacter suis HS1]|nr:hypothetical protein HSUHS1_0553 [Helicobacter suis HS1]
MRIFHMFILACLLTGCGYKAPPFYKPNKPTNKPQTTKTQKPSPGPNDSRVGI